MGGTIEATERTSSIYWSSLRAAPCSSLPFLLFPSWNVRSDSFAYRLNNLFTHPVCNAFVQRARSQHKVCCSCRNEALYDLACGRWILSWVTMI
jgi:hypothetical protein